MHANNYKGQDTLSLGPLTLTNRTIRCGKDGCSTCSDGPGHLGQWYARVPGHLSASGQRLDVYLGQHWNDGDVKRKVITKLNDFAKHETIDALDTIVSSERLKEIETELGHLKQRATKNIIDIERTREGLLKQLKATIKRAKADYAHNLTRYTRDYKSEKKDITDSTAKLAIERQALTAKLKGKKARPTSPPSTTATPKTNSRRSKAKRK